MPDQIQLRGGTEADNDAFTGVTREVTVDTTNKTLRVHDGTTSGGSKLAAYDDWGRLQVADPQDAQDVTNKSYVDGAIGDSVAVVQIGAPVVVGSGGASEIEWESIPADYQDLIISINGRSTRAASADDVKINFNDDTGNNYNRVFSYDTITTSPIGGVRNTSHCLIGTIPGATAPANQPGSHEVIVFGYSNTVFNKTLSSHGYYRSADADTGVSLTQLGGDWMSTAAINRVTLASANGDFAEGTVAVLYGRKATA